MVGRHGAAGGRGGKYIVLVGVGIDRNKVAFIFQVVKGRLHIGQRILDRRITGNGRLIFADVLVNGLGARRFFRIDQALGQRGHVNA
jgi:hypothetical protein